MRTGCERRPVWKTVWNGGRHHGLFMMNPPRAIHQRLILKLCQAITNYMDEKGGSCEVFPAPFAVFLNEDDKNGRTQGNMHFPWLEHQGWGSAPENARLKTPWRPSKAATALVGARVFSGVFI
ncbi:MAG: hypothetical protein HFH38_11840 [Lachnospiraceae bacterium]|nr:hypothetical protein [Lachnospiraceae bacterium]